MKPILDVCCGSKMFWFDKKNPHVLFGDLRKEKSVLCDGRILDINPDFKMDFRKIPFLEGDFRLVVFDPPHMFSLGANSWTAKKYGCLTPEWKTDIKKGFDECMRVLADFGVLIFKWNESEILLSELLKVINVAPLFGHTSGRQSKTVWLCFMKGVSV